MRAISILYNRNTHLDCKIIESLYLYILLFCYVIKEHVLVACIPRKRSGWIVSKGYALLEASWILHAGCLPREKSEAISGGRALGGQMSRETTPRLCDPAMRAASGG